MKDKKFGFDFWKGMAEVITATGIVIFFLIMMLIFEYQNDK